MTGSREPLVWNDHRTFSAKVVSARKALTSGEMISAEELLQFLSEWLVNHILKTDFKLADHMKKSIAAQTT
jgi:hemerythrin